MPSKRESEPGVNSFLFDFTCFYTCIDVLLIEEDCVDEQPVFNCLLLVLHWEIVFLSPSLFIWKWQFI